MPFFVVPSVVKFCKLLRDFILFEHKSAYEQVFKAAGVKSCKLTHDRTTAIQNLGQFISSPFQIASLTKHIIDNKLSSAYQAEADREVCKVQAGFDKDEPWFVPESNLDCTASLAAFERHLLPEIDHWRSEAKNRNGDKSSCADDFLHQVLPFLVEVVVQCGIYFIEDFPQHPFGELLKQMNGYEQWAS